MAAVAFVAAIGAIVIGIVCFFQSSNKKKVIDKLAGPPALPLIGNAHQLRTSGPDFYGQLLNFARDYKDVGMFRLWLGVVPIVATYKPELCEVVLNSTKHMDKSFVYNFLHPWLGTGLLTSKGTKWHARRKMLTPTFHFKILSDFVSVFTEEAQILKEKLRSKVGDKPFNIFPQITLCALDIICKTAMGKHVNAQNNSDSEYVRAVYRMSTILMNRMKAPWTWPEILFNTIGQGSEHTQCLHILHGFTQKVIREKRLELGLNKSSEKTGDNGDNTLGRKKRLAFMDMLLHISDDGAVLSDDDIREEVDTFMFEGHDTTAAAMNWAVYLIGNDKRIQQKVHEELDSVFGTSDRPATADDLKEMKYLECCVKEALRLYPSVPMFGRTLTEDAEIGGHNIPKDTNVVVLTSALHRDPRYFPDPEVYKPDRFLPDNIRSWHPYSYVPFSAGMRNCIVATVQTSGTCSRQSAGPVSGLPPGRMEMPQGNLSPDLPFNLQSIYRHYESLLWSFPIYGAYEGQKFALMEEKAVLSTIFRNFSVTTHQKREDLRPVGDLILRPEEGIQVTLSNRV